MPTDGKSKILDAARAVIGRNGINGATVRVIADEAGLSTGAIYHYYHSKEEILYDLMDMNLSESTKIAEETRHGAPPRKEILEKILANTLLRFQMEEESRIKFYLAQEGMIGNAELSEKFREKYKEWIEGTEELLWYLYGKPTSEEGLRRVKAIASFLIAAIDGTVIQLMMGVNVSSKEDIHGIFREIMENLLPEKLSK